MYMIRARVFGIYLWLYQSSPALLSSFVYRLNRSKGRLNILINTLLQYSCLRICLISDMYLFSSCIFLGDLFFCLFELGLTFQHIKVIRRRGPRFKISSEWLVERRNQTSDPCVSSPLNYPLHHGTALLSVRKLNTELWATNYHFSR